ncbi:MAG: Gfo/Idh/MocA family oxidoreductase [Planctomycetota bacterium]|nr:Gfo/Idh/MocA family oxidoreductase [Planctomycetota bacterium]
MSQKKAGLSRRGFLGGAAAAAATFLVVPRHVLGGAAGRAPSDRINIAGIGVGGQGHGDVKSVSGGNNIVALCDVDEAKASKIFGEFPDAKKYKDFRKMFDEMEKGIDAVVIGTPDHTHAVVAMAAIKRKKHVYCEKPLAHSVAEVRALTKAAKDYNVVTQLGNQGHSSDSIRLLCEWIWDGAIGKVQKIDLGCATENSALDDLDKAKAGEPVPPTLDWDLWLGPAQPRPYSRTIHPYKWRGWVPFGNGTIGDWTCHVIDPVFWAFDLGAPTSIVAQAKDYDPKTQGDAFPKADQIIYEFPAKGRRGPITLHWYSGTEKIPRPKELEPDAKHYETGAVVYGDKGVIHYGSHGAGGVRLIPEERMKAYKQPEPKIPRVRGGHHGDWVNAIREGRKAGSDFSYGGPLTEIAMLGVIALKMPGTKLIWDAQAMRFTNVPAANQFINPPYRAGWTL